MTLLPELLERLKSGDVVTAGGVLETANSIFKRYRCQSFNQEGLTPGAVQHPFPDPALPAPPHTPPPLHLSPSLYNGAILSKHFQTPFKLNLLVFLCLSYNVLWAPDKAIMILESQFFGSSHQARTMQNVFELDCSMDCNLLGTSSVLFMHHLQESDDEFTAFQGAGVFTADGAAAAADSAEASGPAGEQWSGAVSG
jgi:hypothetical protein